MGHFLPFYHRNSPKNQNLKKWKKHLKILSFYNSIPKIMIICYTVAEIWQVTDVIVIFHFGLFLPFYPPNSTKNQNLKKWKKPLGILSFYICVPKIMIRWCTVPEIWYVTNRWMDGKSDIQRRWVPHLKRPYTSNSAICKSRGTQSILLATIELK